MSGIASIAAGSLTPGHLPSLSSAKAAQTSGLGSGAGSSGTSASGNTTSTISNVDGSLTTTTINAQGQIVSSTTTQPANQAVIASNMARQANLETLQEQMPSSLLNMVV